MKLMAIWWEHELVEDGQLEYVSEESATAV